MGARGVGRFKNAKAEERFLAAYDAFRDQNWPVPFTDLDVPTRFGSTHVRRSGAPEGSPIVLLHPNSGTSMSWYRLVAPLARRHAVYALDTIGTAGRSVQSKPVHNAADLATWLDDALTELALDGVNLVGYSEGGWLAALAMVHAPARLASVTLIEPGGAIIHEVGGAIMGADPRSSVVNSWGQTWDVPNLFVADGAVFASNADKNPTLTIMALSWRASDHILERMKRKEL